MGTITVNAETYSLTAPVIVFYVRPTGTVYGTGDGESYDNAWAGFSNITKSLLIPGATLYICGEHTEMLDITGISGISVGRVTIRKDYPSDVGSIKGSTTIPDIDWSVHSGNVYKASNVRLSEVDTIGATFPVSPAVDDIHYYTGSMGLDDPMKVNLYRWSGLVWEEYSRAFVKSNQLFIDRKRMSVARFPKDDVLLDVTIDVSTPPAGTHSTMAGLNAFADADLVGARYIVKPRNFGLEERIIEAKSGNVITHGQLWWGGVNPAAVNPDPGGYIEGAPVFCTSHGDWCYWNDEVYVYLDSAPSNYEISYSNIQHGIFGQNNEYVDIINGDFFNTNNTAVQLEYPNNCTVDGNIFSNIYVAESSWWPYSGVVNIRGTDWADCTINTVAPYDTPLLTESLNIDVINNLFVNSYGGNAAIHYYATNGGSMDGNKILNSGAFPYELKAQANHTRLWACRNISDDLNIMSNTDYAGLEAYSSDFSFDTNIISNSMMSFTDGGAYHGWSIDHTANNNIIFNSLGNQDQALYSVLTALYTDNESGNVTFNGNICFDNDWLGGVFTYGIWSNATGGNLAATNNYVYQDNGQYIGASVPERDFDIVTGNTTGLMSAFDPATI